MAEIHKNHRRLVDHSDGPRERFEVSIHSPGPFAFSDVQAVFETLRDDLTLVSPPIDVAHDPNVPPEELIAITQTRIDRGRSGKFNIVTASFVRVGNVTTNARALGYHESPSVTFRKALEGIPLEPLAEPVALTQAVERPLQTV